MSAPPRVARWILRRCLPRRARDFVVGDLDEAFARRALTDPIRARRWYRRQAILSGLYAIHATLFREIRTRSFGLTGTKEGLTMQVHHFIYDVRHGARALRRSPLFTIAALGTLTLGIGGTVALFSVMKAVLLEPPAFEAPERVVNLYETREGNPESRGNMSYPDVMDLKEATQTLAVVSARQSWAPTLLGAGDPIRIDGSSVNADYFSVYGVQPAAGRLFDEGDGAPGHTPVVVLSHGFWVDRFGGSHDVIGTTLALSGTSYEVVGVAPEGFEDTEGPEMMWRADPPHFDVTQQSRTGHSFRPAARMAPGYTLADVNAELQQINAALVQTYPEKNGDTMLAVAVMDVLVGQSRSAILLLFAAVSLLLVISCANVANLLLGRAAARRRELAVRVALGASPGRLSRHLLTESLVLATLGGVLGTVFAFAIVPIFVEMSTAIPRASRVAVDPVVLVFALGISVAVGIAFGLAPVWMTRGSQTTFLRSSQRNVDAPRGWTLRNSLVVGELALSVTLLTGAGLLVRSFMNLQHVDKGVRTEGVLTMNITPSGANWPDHSDLTRYWEQVVAGTAALPGVRTAGAVSFLPMSGGYEGQGIWRTDRPLPEPGQFPGAEARAVTPGYFEAIGINVVRGRRFTAADDSAAAPVIAINQTLANELFPGEDPLGKMISVQRIEHQIVGVVTDARQFGVQAPVRPEIYAPHAQPFVWWIRRSMDLVVHADVEPDVVAASVRRVVWEIDPSAPIADVKTMDTWVAEDVSAPRFRTVLLATFSTAALLLAMVGITGVLSYAVTRRTAEFGLRAALGASRGDVVRMVLGQGGRLIAIGLMFGLVLATATARFLESLLFGIASFDPMTIGTVAGGVVVVSILAMLVPALRAGRISPMVAMRE